MFAIDFQIKFTSSTLTPFSPNSSMVCLTTGSFHPVLHETTQKWMSPPLESFTTSVVSLNQSTIALDSSRWTSNFSYKGFAIFGNCHVLPRWPFCAGDTWPQMHRTSPSWTSICNHSKNCSKVSGFSTLMSSLVTPKYAILTCSATLLSELLGEQQNSTKIPMLSYLPQNQPFPTPPGTNSSNGSKTDSGGSPFWFFIHWWGLQDQHHKVFRLMWWEHSLHHFQAGKIGTHIMIEILHVIQNVK